MTKGKVTGLVEEILTPFLSGKDMELYNVEFVKEGRDWYLRVYIDKVEGAEEKYICTDNCEEVSRFLSEKLDEDDPIEQNYYLEVSSPGMDRELYREKDYKRFKGHKVEVKLYQAVGGRKHIEGTLIDMDGDNLFIKDEKEEELTIPMEKVAKTKLAVEF